ncbi:hypothetical protein KSP39_PZI005494 [Platanthera zijinensis]|uniref:Uncharacterized protein n=1 Tax=Platanthera zijinensis TaxID=2320716 RepID=A0AAP0BVC6_9ASPA
MSLDGAAERRDETPAGNGSGNGMGAAVAPVAAPVPLSAVRASYGDRRLRLNPNKAHKPDMYDDVQSEFDPSIFCSLERHLPPSMLEAPRDAKFAFMREILSRYLPEGDRARVRTNDPLTFYNGLMNLSNLGSVVGFPLAIARMYSVH